MQYNSNEHTFAICAFGESPYLEACILSLKNQSVKSNIIMITSTPGPYLEGLTERYDIPLSVNPGPEGIAGDWNYAYHTAKTGIVTIAHQDDTYEPDYVKTALSYLARARGPMIFFTDYYELRNGESVKDNKLLKVKRLLLRPLRPKVFWHSKFVRRRVLSFGCPICCPAVTFVKQNLPQTVFESGFKSDLDWQAWEMLSRRKGSFVYAPLPLMHHRIHEESATTQIIGDSLRNKEDYEMFKKFWPGFIARRLAGRYKESENSNLVD